MSRTFLSRLVTAAVSVAPSHLNLLIYIETHKHFLCRTLLSLSLFSFYFVGIGQRISGYIAANAHVIEFASLRAKTRLDISEAFPISKLCKGHAEKLVETGEVFDLVISTITVDTSVKGRKRHMFYDLRENQFACIHR